MIENQRIAFYFSLFTQVTKRISRLGHMPGLLKLCIFPVQYRFQQCLSNLSFYVKSQNIYNRAQNH